MLEHLSSVYRPIVSGRLFHEVGNLKDCFAYNGSLSVTFFCVLQNVWQTISWSRNPKGLFHSLLASSAVIFLWVLQIQFIKYIIKQSKKEQILAQMTNLATMTVNSIRSFFHAYHLWSKLVPAEAQVSHVKVNSKFLKNFKSHIL